MNGSGKAILLAAGTYIVTMGVAFFIAVLAIVILYFQTPNCSNMGRALVALWLMIGAVCLASVVVLIALLRKYVPDADGRTAIVAVYGVVTFVSYLVVAFGLMVLFNC